MKYPPWPYDTNDRLLAEDQLRVRIASLRIEVREHLVPQMIRCAGWALRWSVVFGLAAAALWWCALDEYRTWMQDRHWWDVVVGVLNVIAIVCLAARICVMQRMAWKAWVDVWRVEREIVRAARELGERL